MAKFYLSFTLVFILSISLPFLPDYLLGRLEKHYHQFDLSHSVKYILVLGASQTNDGTIPITSRLGRASLYRTNEAVRIYRAHPNSQILLSGGAVFSEISTADANEAMILALGVSTHAVRVADSQAQDTQQEAHNLYALLKSHSFALVTSASHMPRAMKYFEDQGLSPIAAPTDHLVKKSSYNAWWKNGPSYENIQKMHVWWYETLASFWQYLQMTIFV